MRFTLHHHSLFYYCRSVSLTQLLLSHHDRIDFQDSSPHPKSNLNPHLESLESLAQRYHCPVYHSLTDLFNDPSIGPNVDGAIVCTPHSTHFNIGKQLIAEGQRRYEEAYAAVAAMEDDKSKVVKYRRINVLMEKPMTTNVDEARELHDLLMTRRKREEEEAKKRSNSTYSPTTTTTTTTSTTTSTTAIIGGGIGCFLINHSANYRPQARAARELIQSSNNNKIGHIRHVSAFFASPLSWIFNDPSNKGWNEPDDSGTMLGNGFAWGQSSHILAWIYHVIGPEQLIPTRVFCSMTKSDQTGADVSHAATIICNNGETTFSLSGTSLLPGNAHSDPPVAKRIMIKIFGTKGAVIYSGNDRDSSSGTLEYLRGCGHDDDDDNQGNITTHNNVGAVEMHCPELGFQFEDLDQDGIGPESMQCFIDACLGRDDFYVGADSLVGLRSIQTIDAMYRSNASGNCECVRG